ncbi:hypothetical protein [Pseudonocardia sp.]|uniref:hypothetical protein n=1 Tax=Pseudonocardia sp. TaxID=60912 RepID=UPI002632D7E0|nr:hypothetical protein [Pseudonocardia sp.]
MTRLRLLAPLLAAGALAAMAVATVRGAGCDDPGYYAPIDGGYELVGGCVAAGDLLVPSSPTEPPTDVGAPDRG